jgi:hypothetical protein
MSFNLYNAESLTWVDGPVPPGISKQFLHFTWHKWNVRAAGISFDPYVEIGLLLSSYSSKHNLFTHVLLIFYSLNLQFQH